MSKVLRVSEELTFPLTVANKTIVIFGKGGSGKSNLEVVLAEELHHVGVPTCIVDPADIHYGIKSSLDGKAAGLPYIVFGGMHADVPIYPENGKLLADLFLDRGLYMVLVTQQWTGGEKARFMADFANQLYKRGPEKEQRGSARMLIVEEAHEYMPQDKVKGEEVMLGAMKRLYTVARNYWYGFIAATRRPAKLHKDISTQGDIVVFFQVTGPQDRKAVMEYLGENADKDVRDEILSHLASLPKGTAYVYQPHAPSLEKIHFRYRATLDTSTTEIIAGHKAIKPVLAPVDLEQLGTAMAQAREKAQQEDPRYWQRQVAQLKAELQKVQKVVVPAPAKVVEKRVEVPVIKDQQVARLESAIHKGRGLVDGIMKAAADITEAVNRAQFAQHQPPPLRVSPPPMMSRITQPPMAPRPMRSEPVDGGDFRPGGGSQRILNVLAWLESVGVPEAERTQVAALSDLAPRAGTFSTYLSRLTSAGLIEHANKMVRLTEAGRAAADPQAAPQTTEELHRQIFQKLGGGMERILRELIRLEGMPISKQELAARTNLAANAGTYSTYLSRLRSLGFIEVTRTDARAASVLFLEPVG